MKTEPKTEPKTEMDTEMNTHRESQDSTALAATMQAVTQRAYGDADVLRIETIERPEIGADEVLVEVRAAAVDRGTEHLLTGRPYLIRLIGYGLTKPKQSVPGLDVAGVVVAVGDDVTRFRVGDEVFGIARGSFAEYAAALEKKLVHKPAALSFEQAAAAAVSGGTALQALTDVGGLEPGQRVLVIGASGGVGSFAVQLARALGGRVDGVAGTRNLELVRSLGAERVFDHRTAWFDDVDGHYDLIVDIGGRNPLRKLRRILAPRGTLVIVGGENGNRFTGGIGRQLRAVALSPFLRQRLTMMVTSEDASVIERLSEHLASGAVDVEIGARFPLAETAEAMRRMAEGKASGKTVIVVRAET